MIEIWKDVVGYEGFYVISNQGNVKSLKRDVPIVGGKVMKVEEKLLKLSSDKKTGAKMVSLNNTSTRLNRRTFVVARLMLEAFTDPSEYKKHINFKDEDRSNVVLENVCWSDTMQRIPKKQ